MIYVSIYWLNAYRYKSQVVNNLHGKMFQNTKIFCKMRNLVKAAKKHRENGKC